MKLPENKKASLALKIVVGIVALACWAFAIKGAIGGIGRYGGRFFSEAASIFSVTIGYNALALFAVLAIVLLATRKIFKNAPPPLFGKIVTYLCAGFFIVVAVERALKVSKRFSDRLWDSSYFIGKSLFNDAMILLALILLLSLLALVNREKISLLIRIVILAVVGTYLADFLVFNYFTARLYFADIQNMAEGGGVWSVFKLMLFDPLCRNHIYAGAILGVLFLIYGKPLELLRSRLFLAGSAIFVAVVFLRPQFAFPYEWAVRNFVQVYVTTTYNSPYSAPFTEQTLKRRELLVSRVEKTTSEKPRNIIFVDLESLSSWQSKFFSGIRDVTPNLDRIAGENLAYRNFYANSYKTSGGLLAILKSELFLPPTLATDMNCEFGGRYGGEKTLPKVLKSAGYNTEFLTTGDLNFTDKGNWLRSIGFDFVEGHDNPLYYNYPRFHFQSVPDEALYKRALSRLYAEDLKEPFFLFIETVSTHQPFIDPLKGTPATIEYAMKYADEQLGIFYDELKRRGFLEEGVLIVSGDHRSMTPPIEGEEKLFGESFTARVPLVIGGADFPRGAVEDAPFQQMDIMPSLAAKYCQMAFTSTFLGDFLGKNKVSPRYIFHWRGDDRSLVSVFGEGGSAVIKLDGDDTSIQQGKLEEESLVLDKVNFERIITGSALEEEKKYAKSSGLGEGI